MLAILFRWHVQSCSHDIVWLWCSHGFGHGSDHHTLATRYCAIAHLPTFELQSFYLLLICRHCPHPHFIVTIPFCCFVLFLPLEMQSTLCVYARIVVSIGKEGYQSSSALAVTVNTLEVAEYRLIFLGGRWPDDVWFPCRSRDSPPLVVVWAEDASIMRQTLMM
jgi:hypothetical protein